MNDSITDNTNITGDPEMGCQMQSHCHICAKELCLRQQVINLAVGQIETMYCLACLGKRDNLEPEFLLAKSKKYILSRQCFSKEWIKYKDVSDCPDSQNCLPGVCFKQ